MYIYDGNVSHMNRRMCWWDYTQSINCSFVHKAKEGRHVRIKIRSLHLTPPFFLPRCMRFLTKSQKEVTFYCKMEKNMCCSWNIFPTLMSISASITFWWFTISVYCLVNKSCFSFSVTNLIHKKTQKNKKSTHANIN